MKKIKKSTLSVLPIILLAISGIYINNTQTGRFVNELVLNNIEALADNENNIDGIIFCLGTGNVNCPINNEKVEVVVKNYALK